MKTILLIALFGFLNTMAIAQQKLPKPDANTNNYSDNNKNKDTTPHQSLLNQILVSLDSSIKAKPTETNARIAYEFKTWGIYPNEDALELLHILNPWLDTVTDEIPVSRIIHIPQFPTLGKEKRLAAKLQYSIAGQPDAAAGKRFDSLSDIFLSKVTDSITTKTSSGAFHPNVAQQKKNGNTSTDYKLLLCKKKVLPYLRRTMYTYGKAQADYINETFTALIGYIQTEGIAKSETLEDIADEFFEASNYDYLVNYQGTYENILNHNSQAFFKAPDNWEKVINTPLTNKNLIKCRVYIYDTHGKVMNDSFKLYYIAYVSSYIMKDSKTYMDSVNFLSTLCEESLTVSAAQISITNNSNWGLYFQDTSSPHIYTTGERYNFKDISARSGMGEDAYYRILVVYHGK